MSTAKILGVSLVLIALLFPALPLLAQGTFYGDSATMGQGIIRTWVETGANNVPLNIGVTFTAAVLQALPPTEQDRSMNLPQVTSDTLFKHVYFNWEPTGHPPVYFVPHFDIHFYIVPAAVRAAIPGGIDSVVASQFVPPNYSFGAPPPEDVPAMGLHYVDTTGTEFHGAAFMHTLVYGYFHGQFYFYEPMLSRAYLETHPNDTFQIPQPEAFQRSGYYPTTYHVMYDAVHNSFTVSIGDFVFRNVGGAAVGDPPAAQPSTFALLGNYPNPFNPGTTIQYVLPRASHVTLTIYNLLGEEVATLVDGMVAEGTHAVRFDGSGLASGMYLYRLQSADFISTKPMLLLK